MVVTRRAELVATSRADELALRALADVARITAGEDARIVGGQMTSLLLTAFSVPGVQPRRTRDADAAITTELAGSGILHDRLLERGYVATAGNSYARPVPELAIPDQPVPRLETDLLVPSRDSRFRAETHGGRQFDAVPGLRLALAAPPIEIAAAVTFLDGSVDEFVAFVPPVEVAVVVKAHAWVSRHEPRDVEDLYRLLEIVETYSPEEIGGWALDDADLRGGRGDAAAALWTLTRQMRRLSNVGVPVARLAALIAAHVRRPAT